MIKYNNHIFYGILLEGDFSMKNSAYQNSKLKHQLREKKNRGVEEVLWKLTPEQEAFIKNTLRYRVEACLYQVKTKKLAELRSLL